METTKTRAQLVAMAADHLGIVGSGQSLASDDEDKIDENVDVVFAELAARGVVVVADEDEIPAEWCGRLAELLADEVAPIFGKPHKSPQERTDIEDRLRVMVQRLDASSEFLKIDANLPMGYYRYNVRTG